ncbi:MAG: DnaB-like helicase N-terminal domain-containing protein [Zymomonas mobilis]|uniref:DnaB-like helicase N-terminal domain-containing protein n=1 Tax=Zymomonas mobilis TaxID=542 RepID=UPI0039ECE63D
MIEKESLAPEKFLIEWPNDQSNCVKTQQFSFARAQPLPANLQAEAALLGALLSDNRLAEDIQIRLREEHFFDPTHRLIYQTIMRQIDRNQLTNPVTIQPLIEKDVGLLSKDGMRYIYTLV